MRVLALLAGCAEASLGPAPGDGGSDGSDSTTTAVCGNGQREADEACDDGNAVDTDACSTTCEGWQYRVPITFEVPAAATNASVLVVLDPASFAYANAAGDGSDLRLSTDQNANAFDIPYWFEAWDATGESLVWARVPSLSAGMNTIWAFYGNSVGVAAASDFATTFPNTLRTTGNMSLTGAVSYDAVIVETGHTVTVTAGAPLAITAGYVRIDGAINADAAGHPAGAGLGPGGGSTNAGAGGGGHGGIGGAGGADANDSPGSAGLANDAAASEAIEMGSGGGSTDLSTGGRGGGAVRIDAQHILVAGSISARGQNGGGSPRSSGGGAGGGVLLRARSIGFTGSIVVAGGAGGSGADTVNDGGGGGGGGRVKLLHAGHFVDTGTAVLDGGTGGVYGDTTHGRPGTIGIKQAGTSTTLGTLPSVGGEERL